MGCSTEITFKHWEGEKPDLVVISPSDPEAMKQHVTECRELGIAYLYDPSQQIVRLTGEELRTGIEGALALFVNDYEFSLTQKMTGLTSQGYADIPAIYGGDARQPGIDSVFKGKGI